MELVLINKDGKELDLLNSDYFILSKCDGAHGIETEIATSDNPYVDGAEVSMVKAEARSISITFKLIPDIRDAIDAFTSVVKSKQLVTLKETEKGETITIKGIATIPPYSRMMAMCEITLTIYCGQPYWEDLDQIVGEIARDLPRLYFPMKGGQFFTRVGRVFSVVNMDMEKTFYNDGDDAVGINIKMTALGNVTNPRISCSTGDQNGFYMELLTTIAQNDVVEINTERGNKYIKINGETAYKGAPAISYLNFVGTDWLQMETGENTFVASSSSGGFYFTISYRRKFA